MFNNRIKIAFLFFFFFLLEFSFFPYFRLRDAIPDLLSILVVFYVFYVKREKFLTFALLTGLFRDLFSVHAFGLEAIAYFISGYAVYLLYKQVATDYLPVRVAFVFIFGLFADVVFLALLYLGKGSFNPVEVFSYKLFPSLLYTTLLSPLFLIFTRKIMKDSLKQYNLF